MDIQQKPPRKDQALTAFRMNQAWQQTTVGLCYIGLGQLVNLLPPTSIPVKAIGEIFNAAAIWIGKRYGDGVVQAIVLTGLNLGCIRGIVLGAPDLVFTVGVIAISSYLSGVGSSRITCGGGEIEEEARARNQRRDAALDLV